MLQRKKIRNFVILSWEENLKKIVVWSWEKLQGSLINRGKKSQNLSIGHDRKYREVRQKVAMKKSQISSTDEFHGTVKFANSWRKILQRLLIVHGKKKSRNLSQEKITKFIDRFRGNITKFVNGSQENISICHGKKYCEHCQSVMRKNCEIFQSDVGERSWNSSIIHKNKTMKFTNQLQKKLTFSIVGRPLENITHGKYLSIARKTWSSFEKAKFYRKWWNFSGGASGPRYYFKWDFKILGVMRESCNPILKFKSWCLYTILATVGMCKCK